MTPDLLKLSSDEMGIEALQSGCWLVLLFNGKHNLRLSREGCLRSRAQAHHL